MSQVIELGLEGLSPNLVRLWAEDLPNLATIKTQGIWGEMQSVVPPLPQVTWSCSQTGMSPGHLGFWGPRYRETHSYSLSKDVTSSSIKPKPLYKLLPIRDKKVATIDLPATWPPPRIMGGYAISPVHSGIGTDDYTSPKTLKSEIEEVVGVYLPLDVPVATDRDTLSPELAKEQIMAADKQRCALLNHFITTKQCDYIIAVISGSDLMSRLFYRYLDTAHHRYEEDPRYADTLKEYYIFLDEMVGEVLDVMDLDANLFVHSNHGIQRLDGRVNLNEWLIREGYLNLLEEPSQVVGVESLSVDWTKTKAWVHGQDGALYLNVKGREPDGIVEPSQTGELLDELIAGLKALDDPDGNRLETMIFKREEIHPGPLSHFGPDMLVFFNEGHWRASDAVGSGQLHSRTSPAFLEDVANSFTGFYCLMGPGVPKDGERQNVFVIDVAPTVLNLMGEQVPEAMEGRPVVGKAAKEEVVRDRLTFLGY